jgi:TonB family protein
MKRNILIILFLSFASYFVTGQEVIEKRYFKSKSSDLPVDEKKAKVVELITKEKDGALRYEMRGIKNNNLIRLRSYKDGSPVGKWVTDDGKSLDYDFDLPYRDKEYDNIVYYDLIYRMTTTPVIGNFEPPVFPLENDNFRRYVVLRLTYPEASYENGIQGNTICQFIINESGKLVDLSVLKSADKVLDKEVARVIRQSPTWKPAMVDGKPVSVGIRMSVIFAFQL